MRLSLDRKRVNVPLVCLHVCWQRKDKILGVQNQLKKAEIVIQTTVISKSQEATHQRENEFLSIKYSSLFILPKSLPEKLQFQ